MNRRRNVVVRRPDQLRAIASPLAQRIVGAMEHLSRATVAQIAEFIGTPAGSLYYHVRRMHGVGLLQKIASEKTTRKSRAVYQLAGRELVVDTRAFGEAQVRERVRIRRIMLRFAERSLETGTRHRSALRGRTQRVKLIQRHVRLGGRDLAELNRRLEELAAWVADRDDPDAALGCVVTLAQGPMPGS